MSFPVMETGKICAMALISYILEVPYFVKLLNFHLICFVKLIFILAKQMEPTVTGTVTSATGGKESNSTIVKNIVDVAHGGLLAYAKVYESLEDAGKILGNSLKDNSVKVVEHKHGSEARDVCSNAMTAAGDAAITYMNIQSFGVKGMLKETAKDSGKQLGKSVLEAHSNINSNV